VTMTAPPFVVHCPSCSSGFPVDPGKVPPAGVHAICSVCLRVFPVTLPGLAAEFVEEEFADRSAGWIPEGVAISGAIPGVAPHEEIEGDLDAAMPGGIDVDDSMLEGEGPSAAGWIEIAPEAEVVPDVELISGFEVIPDFEMDSDAAQLEVADDLAVEDRGGDSLDEADAPVHTEGGDLAEWALQDPESGATLDISPDVPFGAEFDIGDDLDGGTHTLTEEDFEARGVLGDLHDLMPLAADQDSETVAEVDSGPEFGIARDFAAAGEIRDEPGSGAAVEIPEGDEQQSEEEPLLPRAEGGPLETAELTQAEVVPDAPRDPPPAFQDLTSLAQEALEEAPAPGDGVPVDPVRPATTVASGAPRFGRRNPSERARHLARVLVSDIIAYHPERYRESFAQGTLKEDFRAEVDKSWKEYVDQVGPELAESTPYFLEALNDVLGQGRHIF